MWKFGFACKAKAGKGNCYIGRKVSELTYYVSFSNYQLKMAISAILSWKVVDCMFEETDITLFVKNNLVVRFHTNLRDHEAIYFIVCAPISMQD